MSKIENKCFWDFCPRKIRLQTQSATCRIQDSPYNQGVFPRRLDKFFMCHISRMQTALMLIRFHYVTFSPMRTYTAFSIFREINIISDDISRTFLRVLCLSILSPSPSSSLSFPLTLQAWGTTSEVRQQFSFHRWKIAWSKWSESENYSEPLVYYDFRKKIAKSRAKDCLVKDNVPNVRLF